MLTHLIFVLFGLYVWEILITLGFEWSLITKARRFSWPLVSTVIVLPRTNFIDDTNRNRVRDCSYLTKPGIVTRAQFFSSCADIALLAL